MSRINSNVPALRAIHQLAQNQADLNLRLERLSTGLRINRGRDDPAGLIISELLRSEISATTQSIDNSARASNVLSTAEAALAEVSALLLDLQELVVSSANEAGLSQAEIRANQQEIDAILESIDRIGHTTEFAGERLLDGSRAYQLSSVPPAAIASLALYSARIPHGQTQDVTVRVTQSAQTARLAFVGQTAGGTSTLSATTIQIQGRFGSQLLSFASGTTLAEARDAISVVAAGTGVSAVVSAVAIGTAASALILTSTEVGSDAFVSVSAIDGNFVTTSNANTTSRAEGQDAGVLINGASASVRGLLAEVRSGALDAKIHLTQTFAQTLSSASFSIAGGGSVFQLTPEVAPNGQLFVGLDAINTTTLGNAVTGLLYTVRAGGENDLESQNYATAQRIVDEAINQVASSRGRIGSYVRNIIDPNVRAQQVALENVTASESVIRDADLAEEVSALTRAQILVQSTQSVLQIANSVPNLVLALLS
ncbi:MAG: flagellin [Phycisphaerae bacterium]|nr:flagellin [Phycisphaerae bacterium]